MSADTPGPICVCTKWHEEQGRYHPECLVHAHWRCVVQGCSDIASSGHLCVIHGRHNYPLSPWGAGDLGEADKECDRVERWRDEQWT